MLVREPDQGLGSIGVEWKRVVELKIKEERHQIEGRKKAKVGTEKVAE